MARFMIISRYGVEVIEAEDWEAALYRAEHGWGDSLVPITLLPKEED